MDRGVALALGARAKRSLPIHCLVASALPLLPQYFDDQKFYCKEAQKLVDQCWLHDERRQNVNPVLERLHLRRNLVQHLIIQFAVGFHQMHSQRTPAFLPALFSTHSYNTGSRIRVKMVELSTPPITTVANGR